MIDTGRSLPQRLDTVQALRGLAAILVLFFHTVGMQQTIIGTEYAEIFNGFWNRGFSGVDMFFVISGFIMVYVTRDMQKGIRTAAVFMKARFLRIYPLWWFYAALMALIYFVIFGLPARPEYASQAGGIAPYLVKSFLLLPQNVPPIIDLGWTLIFEMYYYIIFAFILFLPRRFLPLALGLWISQIIAFQLLAGTGPALNILKSPLSLEFIGGAFMALLVLKGFIFRPRLILIAGGLAFCLALMMPDIHGDLWDSWGRVIFFGLPSLAIIYGLVTLETARKIKPPIWTIWLGNWSYSLYLGHIIVLLVMKNIWEVLEKLGMPKALKLGAPGMLDNVAFAIASVCAAIFAAMLSYVIVERPLIKVLRRLQPHKT